MSSQIWCSEATGDRWQHEFCCPVKIIVSFLPFYEVMACIVSVRGQVFIHPQKHEGCTEINEMCFSHSLAYPWTIRRAKNCQLYFFKELQRSKAEMICALQRMSLRPGAVLLCSRMPTGIFQLQSDLGNKGHELFSQYSGNFSMGFDRESQLIKSYFTIKGGSISLFADSSAPGFFPANCLQFGSLFTFSIDLSCSWRMPLFTPINAGCVKTLLCFWY